MDDDLKQIKAALRKTLLEQTQALPEDYLARSDRGIANALLAFDLWKNARTVFLYVSVGKEPDTRALLRAALKAGKTVAVPRVLPGGIMEARVVFSLDDLVETYFGIPQPGARSPLLPPDALDLVIAPCIAADRQGNRLGHGGGYYDRYLVKTNCPSVCLCRARILQTALPHGALDRAVDIVITENELLRW